MIKEMYKYFGELENKMEITEKPHSLACVGLVV
jgi:hypothetical protein